MARSKRTKADLPEVPGPDASGKIEDQDGKTVLVADEPTGDGGARESEVTSAIERVEAMADKINLGDDAAALVANATDWLVELYKARPKPWGALGQAEQRDLVKALGANAKELVRHIIEAIVREGRPAIRAQLESFTDKDGIKATLKVRPGSEAEELAAVIGLHRARGKIVLLTVASADDYSAVPARDRSEPDQSALGFEAGSDEPPAGDIDLVEAAEPPLLELAQTGKQMLVPDYGLCEIRVNLTSGMVEARAPLRDDFDIDIREATSVELAAERDRVADFDQQPKADEPVE